MKLKIKSTKNNQRKFEISQKKLNMSRGRSHVQLNKDKIQNI